MSEEISLGEVHRKLLSLEQELKEDIKSLVNSQTNFLDQFTDVTRNLGIAANTLSGVEKRLRDIEAANVRVTNEKMSNAEKRIADLESFNVWFIRAILGALIMGAVGILFITGGS